MKIKFQAHLATRCQTSGLIFHIAYDKLFNFLFFVAMQNMYVV